MFHGTWWMDIVHIYTRVAVLTVNWLNWLNPGADSVDHLFTGRRICFSVRPSLLVAEKNSQRKVVDFCPSDKRRYLWLVIQNQCPISLTRSVSCCVSLPLGHFVWSLTKAERRQIQDAAQIGNPFWKVSSTGITLTYCLTRCRSRFFVRESNPELCPASCSVSKLMKPTHGPSVGQWRLADEHWLHVTAGMKRPHVRPESMSQVKWC